MAGALFNFEFFRVLEHQENRNRIRINKRILRDHSDPFTLPDDYFKKLFRLPKVLVNHLLQEINPFIEVSKRITAVPIHIKLLVTLNFVAHGGYQVTVGEDLNLSVSQPVVSRIVEEITTIFAINLLPRYIKFPVTEEDINRIKQRFEDQFGIPNIIGAIDCSHIAIIAPVDTEENPTITYYNRKGYYSINVQAVCDSELNILAINARYPGSTHDSAIWTMSTVHRHLRRKYEQGSRNFWLLGDSGYPLQPWLITPITDAADNTAEGRFSARHCAARNPIERCFGVLKQKFRCLLKHRTLHYDHAKSAKIIYTCAVLHNFCRQHNLNFENDDNDNDLDHINNFHIDNDNGVEQQEPQAGDDEIDYYAEGLRIRRRLVNIIENNR